VPESDRLSDRMVEALRCLRDWRRRHGSRAMKNGMVARWLCDKGLIAKPVPQAGTNVLRALKRRGLADESFYWGTTSEYRITNEGLARLAEIEAVRG
jgi:hypothetical protein